MATFETLICDRCGTQFDMRELAVMRDKPRVPPIRHVSLVIDRGAGGGEQRAELDLCEPCQDNLWERIKIFKLDGK